MSISKRTCQRIFLSSLLALTVVGCPANQTPNSPIIADFDATPREGYSALTVQFRDTSVDNAGEIDSWYWDFGDGATSDDPEPLHTYVEVGEYSVTLYVVTRSGELSMRKENFIRVDAKPPGNDDLDPPGSDDLDPPGNDEPDLPDVVIPEVREFGVSARSHVFGATRPWTVDVWNVDSTTTPLTWTATPSDPWIQVEPSSGSSAGPNERVPITISVSFDQVASPAAGYIELEAPGATPVRLDIAAQENLNLSIIEVRWGQTLLEPTFNLIADKSAVLWVRAGWNYAQEAVPNARAYASLSGEVLGVVELNAPPSLQGEEVASGEPSATTGYYAELPSAWIRSDVTFTVELDPEEDFDDADRSDNGLVVTPSIIEGYSLPLTVIPITWGETTAVVPEFGTYLTEILPIVNVQSHLRAPYLFTGALDSRDGWSQLLSELQQLRVADGSNNFYYGFVPPTLSPLLGLATVRGRAAIGADGSTVLQTMAHELGHNLGRYHSPCVTFGRITDIDWDFPYALAVIGTVGYRHETNEFFDPYEAYDLMSYCFPYWISDYNYLGISNYLYRKGATLPSAAGQSLPEENLLLISGSRTKSGLTLMPLVGLTGTASTPEPGPYLLSLHTPQGVTEIPFQTYEVGCLDGGESANFAFSVSAPKDLNRVEIRHQSDILYVENKKANSGDNAKVDVLESDGEIRVNWDATAYPYASVAWHGDTRVTLAIRATGGSLTLPTTGIEAGGNWEVSLSNGLHTPVFGFTR